MAQQLEVPDLINPYGLSLSEPADHAFIEDLGLQLLLDQAPFNAPASRSLALQALVELNCDQPTRRWRQELFADLVGSQFLLEQLDRLASVLLRLHRQSNEFGWGSDLPTGLTMVRDFVRLVRNPPEFSSARSAGLQALSTYLAALAESEALVEMEQFIQQMADLGGLQLRVTVDEQGVPNEISTVQLYDRDSAEPPGFLTWGEEQSPQHRRQALRERGGLNHLGQLLQNFLSREYVAIVYRFNQLIGDLVSLMPAVDLYCAFASCFNSWRSRGIEICLPQILPAEQRLAEIEAARNPLIEKSRVDDQRQGAAPAIVANAIDRRSDANLMVLTGANNGGKTTYVKTAGLIQLLGQKGWYVPARSARFSEVDVIFTHFVAADDIARGEGRYRNELRRMRTILERATPLSLVILDEPCGGTDYHEGQRQSRILLRAFHLLGAATYFTTHMHELTASLEGHEWSAVQRLQVATRLENGQLRYLYRVEPGIATHSYGEQIAQDLGLGEQEVLNVVRAQADQGGYLRLLRHGSDS